jgi:DNA polymerase III epsilon subunit-like protein
MTIEIVFDIETDAVEATLIHCIALWHSKMDDYFLFGPGDLDEALMILESADILIGHYIKGFDLPVLNRLKGFKFTGTVIDTLEISRRLFPEPECFGKHSLYSWGNILECPKIEVGDFTVYDENMGKRCLQDVKISKKVYDLFIELINEKEIK